MVIGGSLGSGGASHVLHLAQRRESFAGYGRQIQGHVLVGYILDLGLRGQVG